ncbi:acyl-CoA thioesterase [Telmatospirillum siberiense]|uniref:Thioesterase n=1 Tax=Telmatospirillum siberiense TaxID=382514 RepID=A0A2N3PYV2_9PROT|nr:thioesterase family protein [Telmatospirillum siberiense]PKU25604.1 thioesterase [Telmatospirillum siberiense]
MTSQTIQTYEYDVDVAADDIDEMGHVNNAVYLKWVQAAVLRHWYRLAPKDVAAAHLWVALKHEISYRHPAFLNDHVVVRVVLEKLQGARAFYETIIHHGDEVLAEVKSCWCCLDSVTKKPVRLARDIVAIFLPTEAQRPG